MNDEPSASGTPAVPVRAEQAQSSVPNLAAPLAQLGIETVQDIAAVVRSTGAAGRDLWRLVNVFDRVRHVDWTGAGASQPAAIEAPRPAATGDVAPAGVATPAAPSSSGGAVSSAAGSVLGPFVRVADAALKPTALIGSAVVSPVRRVVSDTMGLGPEQTRDREEDLRAVADELLDRSLQPDAVFVRRHPAFAQILTELTPDEARILRFLAVAGPQPSIDIRTKSPFQIGSERIAYGINMIAEMAGCGWTEFSENYLANLNRLGLIVFSKEPVEDYRRYSLLEVQPAAVEAIEHADLPTISIYRSVYLSAFGLQFCEVCINTEGYTAGGWDVNERGDKIVKLFGRRRKGA